MNKEDLLSRAYELKEEYYDLLVGYWKNYSAFDSWQFWTVVLMLIIPIVILYFKIDRDRTFYIGFFGFCVHVVTSYVDLIGVRLGYWGYPYFVLPVFPFGISLDTSLIPIVFMLLYQWTSKNEKNYWIYAIVLAAIFAFLIKPLLTYLDLFRLHKGMNYFELFLYAYVPIIILSKWLFNIYNVLFNKKGKGIANSN